MSIPMKPILSMKDVRKHLDMRTEDPLVERFQEELILLTEKYMAVPSPTVSALNEAAVTRLITAKICLLHAVTCVITAAADPFILLDPRDTVKSIYYSAVDEIIRLVNKANQKMQTGSN